MTRKEYSMNTTRLHIILIAAILLCGMGINAQEAANAKMDKQPTLMELWQQQEPMLPPLKFDVTSDEIVPSLVDVDKQLRRVDVSFVSQDVFGKNLTHHAVIFIPVDPQQRYLTDPERRGKVVIVGSIARHFQQPFECNYGHPIATRNGYPTMILPNPGETPDNPGREWSIRNLWVEGVPRCATNSYFFRLAIPYVRAMDVFADVLKIDRSEIKAVIGGHSKRAPSAYCAAAIRPDNVAGVVFMGMEGQWRKSRRTGRYSPVSALAIQNIVKAKTIYLGATNEDGYSMFNVTKNQAQLDKPWTVSMVPNYRHAADSEQQFAIWRMWVSHVHDGRPVAKITDVTHEISPKGIHFRAKIDDPNHMIQVRAWYTYCDDVPLWRDMVWYPVLMRKTEDNQYQGYERGKTPDGWFVEVSDVANGVRGYVTSCPQQIGDKPVKERKSRGSRSRQWDEK
jgi:pimeloyl-ACP methyl ester carboxylesterase